MLSLILILLALHPLVIGNSEDSVVGKRPAEFEGVEWLSEQPVRLRDLKGKVALVRWWTGPGCPFCVASSAALKGFDNEYKSTGLIVIGLYHHKSNRPLTRQFVKNLTNEFGFEFSVGIDWEWKNLKRWWLETGDRGWTSVSFLIDRQGVIRYVHEGGAYSVDPVDVFPSAQGDYRTLRAQIVRLLGEQ